jgi:hypothetical protein
VVIEHRTERFRCEISTRLYLRRHNADVRHKAAIHIPPVITARTGVDGNDVLMHINLSSSVSKIEFSKNGSKKPMSTCRHYPMFGHIPKYIINRLPSTPSITTSFLDDRHTILRISCCLLMCVLSLSSHMQTVPSNSLKPRIWQDINVLRGDRTQNENHVSTCTK